MATLLYSLDDNAEAKAILTAKVTSLSSSQQTAMQQTAESLLRLRSPAYTKTEDVERVVLAIVHQMNFLVAQGVDPRFTQTATSAQGGQTNVYRDRVLDPLAAQLVEEVRLQYATSWDISVFTSHRTRSGTG